MKDYFIPEKQRPVAPNRPASTAMIGIVCNGSANNEAGPPAQTLSHLSILYQNENEVPRKTGNGSGIKDQ